MTGLTGAGHRRLALRAGAVRLGGALLSCSVLIAGCARNDGGAPITWGAEPGRQGSDVVTAATPAGLAPGEVRVQEGDTVYGLARGYGVSPGTIVEINRLMPPYDLYPGQILKIPQSETASALNTNVPASRLGHSPSTSGRILVGPGESLYSLARNHNVDAQALARANNLHPPYTLQRGQTLQLPGGGTGTTPNARLAESRPEATRPEATRPAGTAGGGIQVARGDTLYSLARANGVAPDTLAAVNDLSVPYTLYPGQVLRLPGAAPARATVARSTSAPSTATATATGTAETRSAPPVRSSPIATASIDTRIRGAAPSPGGRRITVQEGDNIYTIAQHYGLSVKEVAHHNRLQPPYIVRPGQQLEIPSGGSAAAPSGASTHTVQRGDTLYSIAQTYGVSVGDLRKLNNLTDAGHLSPGQTLHVRADAHIRGKDTPPPVIVAESRSLTAGQPQSDVRTAARSEPQQAERSVAAVPVAEDESQIGGPEIEVKNLDEPDFEPALRSGNSESSGDLGGSGAPAETKPDAIAADKTPAQANPVRADPVITASLGQDGDFIMPVRGRILSGYGPKSNGLHNDGLNIAVAVGTPVRAAKGGTVTYAGQELKGYGKLLLIKHDDGYVTAYAHNSRLLVRQGQRVRQGDIVAESGDTGYVDSPQLHFEIRKGRKSVDPALFFDDMG